MSMLKLDDVDLYYELHGEGPVVVFIHGASGTHLSWWQQIADMRHHFSCLIYDQRGYGRSRPPQRDYPPDFYRRDMEDLAAWFSVQRTPLHNMR